MDVSINDVFELDTVLDDTNKFNDEDGDNKCLDNQTSNNENIIYIK